MFFFIYVYSIESTLYLQDIHLFPLSFKMKRWYYYLHLIHLQVFTLFYLNRTLCELNRPQKGYGGSGVYLLRKFVNVRHKILQVPLIKPINRNFCTRSWTIKSRPGLILHYNTIVLLELWTLICLKKIKKIPWFSSISKSFAIYIHTKSGTIKRQTKVNI